MHSFELRDARCLGSRGSHDAPTDSCPVGTERDHSALKPVIRSGKPRTWGGCRPGTLLSWSRDFWPFSRTPILSILWLRHRLACSRALGAGSVRTRWQQPGDATAIGVRTTVAIVSCMQDTVHAGGAGAYTDGGLDGV
jgi:hypothetical protein